jgi:hypothetical protein
MNGKLWDPVRRAHCNDAGEVTPHTAGVSQGPGPGHKVQPRIAGAVNVARFREMWGMCTGLENACCNGAGHDGECKPG